MGGEIERCLAGAADQLAERINWLRKQKIDFAQNEFELLWYTLAIARRESTPQVHLEIGSREGGSLYAVAGSLPRGSTVIAVDLPGGAWGWEHSGTNLRIVAKRLQEEGLTVELITGNSGSQEVIGRIAELISPHEIDSLFLDGDHSLDGVTKDWHNFGSMVRSGGTVGFHDIAQRADTPFVEVHKLWSQLKTTHRTMEILALYGIGVLWREN